MKLLKSILRILSVLILIIVIGLFGIGYYLDNHKEKVFTEFKQWYSQHHNGSLTFKNVSVNTFKHFPSVSLIVKNVVLTDSLYKKHHQIETFSFEEVDLKISLKNLFKKQIQFKSLILKNGKVSLFTDKNGYSNRYVFSPKNVQSSVKQTNPLFSNENIHLKLKNVDYMIINKPNHQQISGKLNALNAAITIKNKTVFANLNLDTSMKEMGFNLLKGAFLRNTHVQLTMQPTIYLDKSNVDIPPFNLKLNNQEFKVGGNIYAKEHGTFDLDIENTKTNFDKSIQLLPGKIQKTLKWFSFHEPIETKIQLKGSFKHGSNPFVKVFYKTVNNNLKVKDSIEISNLDLKGFFTSEIDKSLKLKIDTLKGNYLNIPFSLNQAGLYKTSSGKTSIQTQLSAKGKAKDLNTVLKNTTFLFLDGTFDLKSELKGNIAYFDSILSTTESELTIKKCKVLHKGLGVEIPINGLNLKIKNVDADIQSLTIPLNDNIITIDGNLTNVIALIFGKKKPVTSSIEINSENLAWENITQLLSKIDSAQITNKPKPQHLVINSFAKTLYKKFNPSIKVRIDKFQYKSFELDNVKAEVFFKNEDEIQLKNMGFDYGNGALALNTNLNISDAHITNFGVEFTTNNLNFAQIIKDYNYFGLKSLQTVEKFTGHVSINADIKGTLNNDLGLDINTVTGKIGFNIDSLSISGFQPIEKIADIVFKKSRFDDIRFASIVNSFYLKNETIEIPQMEIQSTAFNFYVQGHFGFNSNATNLWVSIPLNNLKHREIKTIPKKISYANSGKKVYVQVISNKKDSLDYKFHLTNKRLFEEEGILNEYGKANKQDRKQHKAYKKEERLKRRQARVEVRKKPTK